MASGEKTILNNSDTDLLDRKILKIHKSTKTLFHHFRAPHNHLRMKYSWYYRWHLNSHAKLLHWATLAIFTLVTGLLTANIINASRVFASAIIIDRNIQVTARVSNVLSCEVNTDLVSFGSVDPDHVRYATSTGGTTVETPGSYG